jgi:hypothetical protein
MPPLIFTGVLLPMRTIPAMRGLSTSAMAVSTTTIRRIAVMFVVSGQDNNFDPLLLLKKFKGKKCTKY